MSVPDRNIAVLADFQTARSLIDAKFGRGIDGNHPQHLVLRHPTVSHPLSRILSQGDGACHAVAVH